MGAVCCASRSPAAPAQLSEFQRQKLERIFKKQDFRQSGTVVCEDLLNWGQKVAMNNKIEFSDERKGEWIQMHTIFFKGKAMKFDEWSEYVALFMQNNPTYFEMSLEINKNLCKSLANHDGKIGFDEYFAFVSPVDVSEEDAKEAFKLLDTEGVGSMSIEEFADCIVHYYFDEGENKYMNFFGQFKKQIVVSPFQRKKLERVFALTDMNRSGNVTVDDFILWGEKAATVSKVKFTEERKAEWVNAHNVYFAGKDMLPEEFVQHVQAFMQQDPLHVEHSKEINLTLFNVLDENKDGEISFDEYYAFVHPAGVTPANARVGFDMIDADKNGVLSRDEIGTACARYYFDQEESQYMHFFGKWDPEA